MKHKKLIIILVIAAAAAAAGIAGFLQYKKKKQQEMDMSMSSGPVIEMAVRQDIQNSFTVNGRIVSGDEETQGAVPGIGAAGSSDSTSAEAASSSASAGDAGGSADSTSTGPSAAGDASSGNIVAQVFVKVGDKVKMGDPLYSIDMTNVKDDLWLNQQRLALQERQNAIDQAAKARAVSDAQDVSGQQYDDATRTLREAAEDTDESLQDQLKTNADYQKKLDEEKRAQAAYDTAKASYDSLKVQSDSNQAAINSAQADSTVREAEVARMLREAGITVKEDTDGKSVSSYADLLDTDEYKDAVKAAAEAEEALAIAQADNLQTTTDLANALTAMTDAKTALDTATSEREALEKQLETDRDNTKTNVRNLEKAGSDTRTGNRDKNTAEADANTALQTQVVAGEQSTLEMRDAIRKAQAQLEKGTICAGMNGTVTEVNIAPGRSLSDADAVVISNLDDLKAIVDVDEAHIADISVGQKVYLTTDSTESEPVTGTVTFCAATPTEVSESSGSGSSSSGTASTLVNTKKKVYYRVEVAITSDQSRLRVGMNAKMDFVLSEAKDVIAVPADTIMTDDKGNSFVRVLDPDAAADAGAAGEGSTDGTEAPDYREIKVTTGATDGNMVEITSGNINEGDSLEGTGMSTDGSGMDGSMADGGDASLLEGIYSE